MHRLSRPIVAFFAVAMIFPAAASAQTFSFGSASPTVAAKDTDTTKPVAQDSIVKQEFKPSWSFNAWLFGTYTYTVDSATKAANNGKAASNFTVDRAYLTFRGQVAPDFGFRITTDVKNMPVPGGYAGLFIRLKYAYMQWDYLQPAEPASFSAWARIGQIHTVILEDEEIFWPRWLQKSALEYWGFQPGSADLGASTQLTLPNRLGWVYFTLANGPGYQTAADPDRYKDASLRLTIQPFARSTGLFKTLQVTPWVQVGRTQASVLSKPGLENNAGGLFVGSGDPRLTFGAEYGERQFQTLPVSNVITTTMTVWDGFVQVRPSLFNDPRGVPWGLIARYDDFKANTANSAHRTLVLAGAFIDVASHSSFALTYQDDVGHSEIAPIPTKTMWQLNWQITF